MKNRNRASVFVVFIILALFFICNLFGLLDIPRLKAGEKGNDFLLSEAIRDSGNVILASYIDKEGRYITPLKNFAENFMKIYSTAFLNDARMLLRNTGLGLKIRFTY